MILGVLPLVFDGRRRGWSVEQPSPADVFATFLNIIFIPVLPSSSS